MTRHGLRPLVVAALAVLPLAASGCNPFAGPDPEVRVVISSARFEFGEPLTFEVRNDLDRVVRLQECDSNPWVELLQRIRGEWTSVGFVDCALAFVTTLELAPGDRATGSYPGRRDRGLYAISLPYTSYEPRDSGGFGQATVGNANSEPFHITP